MHPLGVNKEQMCTFWKGTAQLTAVLWKKNCKILFEKYLASVLLHYYLSTHYRNVLLDALFIPLNSLLKSIYFQLFYLFYSNSLFIYLIS